MPKCPNCRLLIATPTELRALGKISTRERDRLRRVRCMCRDLIHGHSSETQCSSRPRRVDLDYYDRRG